MKIQTKNNTITEAPVCPHYKKCGGCQMQNLSYRDGLRWKEATVIKLLSKFCHIEPIIGMEDPYHYRNKVQAAFSENKNHKIVSGIYQSSTHNIVPVDLCMIEDKKADEIIVSIRKLLPSFKIRPYNEYTGIGLLRHVLIKRGFSTGEIMVVLVTSGPVLPSKNNFVKALLKIHPEITTIIQNINPYDTSLVLGEKENILYGPGKIRDKLSGLSFLISARSFYQINPVQTETLYKKAIDYAQLKGDETVIDAYCGIGTIALSASSKAKEVIGVELNHDAVKDAIANTKLNKIHNAKFYTADAGAFMYDMAQNGQMCDVVFMDPPRAGSDEKFLSSLLTLSPKKIVYISCNPETLARDLDFITKSSRYKVQKIQPVDMFPFTHHVETVVLITRVKE